MHSSRMARLPFWPNTCALSERLGVTVTDRKRSRIEPVDTTIHDQDEDAD